MTPIQVGRNLIGLVRFENPEPSEQLINHVRLLLASQIVRQRYLQQAAPLQKVSAGEGLLEEHT